MGNGLLDGVRVLDLSRVLAGPYCAMMLADMGADVIKIEQPGRGDDSRANAPRVNGESAYFINLNRNKRGMTLDLKSAKGKEIFLKLVKESDIVVENYRPGVMKRLGLDYEELRKINPGIVYGAVSGFGQYGPYSQQAGYDIIGQAMSGLMSTTGWPDSPPTRTGTAIADVMAGCSCAIGILGAYIKRLKTGVGDMVDVALVDSMVSSLEIINIIYLCTGRVPTKIGNRYEAIYPYDTFNAKDGMVVIACGNDKLYSLLKSVIQDPDLEAPEFLSNIDRVNNHAPLKEIVERWTCERGIDEIVETLLAVGIPAAPVNTIDRVTKDPHIAGAREMFVDMHHPIAGDIMITGNQIKLSNHKISEFRSSPLLGEHTESIVTEFLGYSKTEYEQMVADGVF